jgi:hypothetical protein
MPVYRLRDLAALINSSSEPSRASKAAQQAVQLYMA